MLMKKMWKILLLTTFILVCLIPLTGLCADVQQVYSVFRVSVNSGYAVYEGEPFIIEVNPQSYYNPKKEMGWNLFKRDTAPNATESTGSVASSTTNEKYNGNIYRIRINSLEKGRYYLRVFCHNIWEDRPGYVYVYGPFEVKSKSSSSGSSNSSSGSSNNNNSSSNSSGSHSSTNSSSSTPVSHNCFNESSYRLEANGTKVSDGTELKVGQSIQAHIKHDGDGTVSWAYYLGGPNDEDEVENSTAQKLAGNAISNTSNLDCYYLTIKPEYAGKYIYVKFYCFTKDRTAKIHKYKVAQTSTSGTVPGGIVPPSTGNTTTQPPSGNTTTTAASNPFSSFKLTDVNGTNITNSSELKVGQKIQAHITFNGSGQVAWAYYRGGPNDKSKIENTDGTDTSITRLDFNVVSNMSNLDCHYYTITSADAGKYIYIKFYSTAKDYNYVIPQAYKVAGDSASGGVPGGIVPGTTTTPTASDDAIAGDCKIKDGKTEFKTGEQFEFVDNSKGKIDYKLLTLRKAVAGARFGGVEQGDQKIALAYDSTSFSKKFNIPDKITKYKLNSDGSATKISEENLTSGNYVLVFVVATKKANGYDFKDSNKITIPIKITVDTSKAATTTTTATTTTSTGAYSVNKNETKIKNAKSEYAPGDKFEFEDKSTGNITYKILTLRDPSSGGEYGSFKLECNYKAGYTSDSYSGVYTIPSNLTVNELRSDGELVSTGVKNIESKQYNLVFAVKGKKTDGSEGEFEKMAIPVKIKVNTSSNTTTTTQTQEIKAKLGSCGIYETNGQVEIGQSFRIYQQVENYGSNQTFELAYKVSASKSESGSDFKSLGSSYEGKKTYNTSTRAEVTMPKLSAEDGYKRVKVEWSIVGATGDKTTSSAEAKVVDTKGPEISITPPIKDYTTDIFKDTKITITASDPSGVSKIKYFWVASGDDFVQKQNNAKEEASDKVTISVPSSINGRCILGIIAEDKSSKKNLGIKAIKFVVN